MEGNKSCGSGWHIGMLSRILSFWGDSTSGLVQRQKIGRGPGPRHLCRGKTYGRQHACAESCRFIGLKNTRLAQLGAVCATERG
jgi:hypothetical protein